jgi:CYTH domain-containing protein
MKAFFNFFHFQGFMTVRRRFLLASSLAGLIQRERGGLRQIEGFFPEQRDRSSWVRLEENRGLLILRTAGPHGEREEHSEVPMGHAHALLDVCAGEIDYTRTKLRIGDLDALVDQFNRPRDLHFVTVEFDSGAGSREFQPLPWFGPEITAEARYSNQAIALRGVEQYQDAPLADEALNGLLDTLENRFPVQPRKATSPLTAKQDSVIKAPARPSEADGRGVQVNLGDIEVAMMVEMERTLQKGSLE